MSSQSQLRNRGAAAGNGDSDSQPASLKEISRKNNAKAVGRGPSVILSFITLITISYVSLQIYAFLSGQTALQVILPPSMSGKYDPQAAESDSNSLSQKYIFNPIKKSLFGEVEREVADQSFKIETPDGRKAEIKIDGKANNEKESELGEDLATKAAKLLLDNDEDASESAELRDDI